MAVFKGTNEGIFHYDLSDNIITQIESENQDVNEPKIYDNKMVWRSKGDVYYYDLNANRKIKVTNDEVMLYAYPAIYKDYIVWSDRRHDDDPRDDIEKEDIYLYDISTGEERRITYSLTWKSDPDIYGNKISWDDYNLSNDFWSIKIYDLLTTGEFEIEGGAGRLWDDKIVYKNINDKGYIALFTYFFSNGKVEEIPKSSSGIGSFDIYDDKIVWDDGGKIIYLYDVSKNKLSEVINIEYNEDIKVWAPSIWENKVVWVGNKDGSTNIYLYIIPEDTIFGLEPTTFYFSITVLIIILILIIVLLIRLRRKKRNQQKQEVENEDHSKSGTLERVPQTFQCPSCSKTFKVSSTKRPLNVKCPHCGVAGELK